MAPPTRTNTFQTPSPKALAGKEATTQRKCKFFDALAHYGGSQSLRSISKEYGIVESTARYWKKQQSELGSPAKKPTWQRSSIRSGKSKDTKAVCKMLVLRS